MNPLLYVPTNQDESDLLDALRKPLSFDMGCDGPAAFMKVCSHWDSTEKGSMVVTIEHSLADHVPTQLEFSDPEEHQWGNGDGSRGGSFYLDLLFRNPHVELSESGDVDTISYVLTVTERHTSDVTPVANHIVPFVRETAEVGS